MSLSFPTHRPCASPECANPVPAGHRKYCQTCGPKASALWKRSQRRKTSWRDWSGFPDDESRRAYMRAYQRQRRARLRANRTLRQAIILITLFFLSAFPSACGEESQAPLVPDGWIPTPAEISSFVASPDQVYAGTTSTLSWQATGFDVCYVGNLEWLPASLPAGKLVVAVEVSTTFYLACKKFSQIEWTYADTTVFVTPNPNPPAPKPPDGTISSPASGFLSIAVGESVHFASDCSDTDADYPLSHLWEFDGVSPPSAFQNPGDITFNIPGTYVITYTCTDSVGQSDPTPDFRTITVEPSIPPPANVCNGEAEFDATSLLVTVPIKSPAGPPSTFLINRWIQVECLSGSCELEVSKFAYVIDGLGEQWLPLNGTQDFINETGPLGNDCNSNPVCEFFNLPSSAFVTDANSGQWSIRLTLSAGQYRAIFPGNLNKAPVFFSQADTRESFAVCARVIGNARVRVGIDYFDWIAPALQTFRDGVHGSWSISTDFMSILLK